MPRIDRMIGNIRKFGVFTPNKYLIQFSGLVGNADLFMGNRLSLMCAEMNLPGRSLTTNEEMIGSGPQRKIPYDVQYSGETSLKFYMAKDLWEKRIFEAWMDLVVDPKTGRHGYYKDYICDMFMIVLNEFDFPLYRVRLEEVYPQSIADVAFTNEGGSEIASIDITFGYRRYVPEVVSLSGAVLQEFLYDISAVRDLDNAAGSIINDLGVFGGRFGNPLNYSTVIEKYADAGAVVDKGFSKISFGSLL